MAMSATLACSPTTLNAGPNGKVTGTLTVSNSGAVDVYVGGIHVWLSKTGAATQVNPGTSKVLVALNPGNAKVPTGGSTVYTFECVMHDPQLFEAQLQVDVNARVKCDDGSYVVPTAVTITVNPAGA